MQIAVAILAEDVWSFTHATAHSPTISFLVGRLKSLDTCSYMLLPSAAVSAYLMTAISASLTASWRFPQRLFTHTLSGHADHIGLCFSAFSALLVMCSKLK
jgi:hypothetical protein